MIIWAWFHSGQLLADHFLVFSWYFTDCVDVVSLLHFTLSYHEDPQFCLTFTDMHYCLLQNEDGCLCTVFVFPVVGE